MFFVQQLYQNPLITKLNQWVTVTEQALHIRTGGWQGSAIADQWQAFGSRTDWQDAVLDYAFGYSRQVHRDWLTFKSNSL